VSKGNKQKDDIKRLHAVLRELRLESEKETGRIRSKTWGGKPSSKEDRRKSKQNLKKMVDGDDYTNGD
jgi:hypothetical protein